MIYINKDIQSIYVDLTFELDANYEQGNSLDDFKAGKWIKLSDAQIAFRNVNPSASVEEVLTMKLNEIIQPETPQITDLEKARQAKYDEINKQDEFSNKFFISVIRFKRDDNGNIFTDDNGNKLTEEIGYLETWMTDSKRNSMLNLTLPSLQKDGEITMKLWSNGTPPRSIEVPIIWALAKIPVLELYCKKTYDLWASNKARNYDCKTIDEINAIDVKADYPPFLTFELNIEL